MKYLDLLADFGIDLVAIFVLAGLVYYRRHRRRDLLLAYVALNVGLFAAMSLLTTARLEASVGFGLFGILSIIRLRASTVTQQEVAYYFISLVLGLVNGLRVHDRFTTILLDVLLIGTMVVADNRTMFARSQRRIVTLNIVHDDPATLIVDLEQRLRGKVLYHQVDEVDYVRGTTVVDVRYRADDPNEPPVERPVPVTVAQLDPTAPQQREITLDVVHTDPVALVTDLEHRLHGEVLQHIVRKVDYVRETMVIDVQYQPDDPGKPPVHRPAPSGTNGVDPNWAQEFTKPTLAP